MKKIITAALVAMALVGFTQTTKAADHTERKGFILGLDAGFGGMHFDSSNFVPKSNDGMFTGSFLIGGALTERVILLADLFMNQSFNSNHYSTDGIYFAVQYFFMNDWYVRPGIGVATISQDAPSNQTLTSEGGFAAGMVGGYEFRLTKRFALSPALRFDYLRTQGGNVYSYGAVADMKWYF